MAGRGRTLERRGVLKGEDTVLLGEALDVGGAQGDEIVLGVLGDLGARGAAQEEGCLGVLDDLGLTVGEGALRAGVLGFSGKCQRLEPREVSLDR